MSWQPPERKPLNIKPTTRPSRESLETAIAYLSDALRPDDMLIGAYDAAMSCVLDELLALQYGMEELEHGWREEAAYTLSDSAMANCADELKKLRENRP